ncbi:MAG: polyprenyl synthetase family protein [Deltaproteobacteria bacterium]|nr:polyprenyl synthetase family protein [Deltaproteobacteria bacterium]
MTAAPAEFDARAYLAARREQVDAHLEQVMDLRSELFGGIVESMRYSLFAGGKRVRPILALVACEAVGGDCELALPAAAALELMHTYTLIHDDLPAMDDDDFRRGRPTNHKVFGEAMALLAGCGLLSIAFEIVARQATEGRMAHERATRAIALLADTIGWRGVIGGQAIDIDATGKEIDLARVRDICFHKTATLIAASVVVGAIAGGGDEGQIAALERFGRAIGLAFQVADDILNVEGDAEKLGKGTGTDADAGKTTFPAVMGLDGAKTYARELLDEANAALAPFGPRADALRAIADYIVSRDR